MCRPVYRQKFAEIKAQPKWNPPADMAEYLYYGKKYSCLPAIAATSTYSFMMKTVIISVPHQAALPGIATENVLTFKPLPHL